MSKLTIKLVTVIAWAGVAISSASPAGAFAITTQVGEYANCSANSSTQAEDWCLDEHTSYMQTIKLVSTTCNAGGCGPNPNGVFTDQVYPAGRKPAYGNILCGSTLIYEFGDCSC